MSNKRNLFNELQTSLKEVKKYNKGKITLKTIKLELVKEKGISPKQIRAIREKYHMSRAVFAHYLHTSKRTLENWEQGISKPNQQATTLLLLTDKYPDNFERLSAL